MCRRRSSRVDQRNEPVLGRVQALKADHPFWSYRRLWTQLHFEEGLHVNKKRVLQLMRDTTLVSAPQGDRCHTRLSQGDGPKPRLIHPERGCEVSGPKLYRVLMKRAKFYFGLTIRVPLTHRTAASEKNFVDGAR